MQWARGGLSVINGEAILIVQSRIEDASVADLDVIPLGADRVFICSSSDVEVSTILEGASEFFANIFSNILRWDKNLVPFQRGAWLRLYDIPLQAWNENFFKLCILDCGRFLRTDSCSVDRDMFDYARILIATPSLEVINCVKKLVVDGEVVEIKILEEWGFNMGEDVCLYDTEDGTRSSNFDHIDIREETVHGCDNVDFLVDKIVNELSEVSKDVFVMPEISVKAPSKNMEGEAEQFIGDTDELFDSHAVPILSCVNHQVGGKDLCGFGNDQGTRTTSAVEAAPLVSVRLNSKLKGRRGRTSSCPPRAVRSVKSGLWSIEWLSEGKEGDG